MGSEADDGGERMRALSSESSLSPWLLWAPEPTSIYGFYSTHMIGLSENLSPTPLCQRAQPHPHRGLPPQAMHATASPPSPRSLF